MPIPRAHGWIWAAIPADIRRVVVEGDPDLVAGLIEAGVDATDLGPQPGESENESALVARLTMRSALRMVIRPRLPEDRRLVLVAGGGQPKVRDGVALPRRAAELGSALLAGAALGLMLGSLAHRLRSRGRAVELLSMGDRSRNSYRISRRPLHDRVPAAGWVLVTSPDILEPSAARSALAQAAEALGTELRVVRATVAETGKLLMVTQGADQRGYMVRLAANPGRRLLANGLAALNRLSAPDVDPIIRRRAVAPLVSGEIGNLLFSAEPLMPGSSPRTMTPQLWRDCIEFLAALLQIAPPPGTNHSELTDAARLIADFTGEMQDREWLVELGLRLDQRFEALPRGWEHGDFWLDNVLVESGRLSSLLDWDTARPQALPMMDMFDLVSLSEPGQESLTPGERLTRTIWPLVTGQTDARLLQYCTAIKLEPEQGLLRDLAQAYWLNRVARDLDEVPDRRHRPAWIAANITAVIRFLRAEEGPGIGSPGGTLGR